MNISIRISRAMVEYLKDKTKLNLTSLAVVSCHTLIARENWNRKNEKSPDFLYFLVRYGDLIPYKLEIPDYLIEALGKVPQFENETNYARMVALALATHLKSMGIVDGKDFNIIDAIEGVNYAER